MNPNTEIVNNYLRNGLLGACVESFGLTHQFLTITFRDGHSNPNDHTLWIDTKILANTNIFDALALDKTARALLLFNHVNLQEVVGIQCTDTGDLTIRFANGVQFTLDASAADEYGEPWSCNLFFHNHSVNIIADSGSGYIIFDSKT